MDYYLAVRCPPHTHSYINVHVCVYTGTYGPPNVHTPQTVGRETAAHRLPPPHRLAHIQLSVTVQRGLSHDLLSPPHQ